MRIVGWDQRACERRPTKLATVGRRSLKRAFLTLLFCLLPSAFCLGPAAAAEIQLRSECQVSGLVRLGDVAEIHTHDAAEAKYLRELELFPAPAAGAKSFVRAREVQDLLALRGVNLAKHRLAGASHIEIHNGAKSGAPLSSSMSLRATQRVEAAIEACLGRQAGKEGSWKVEAALDEEQVRLVTATKEAIAAEGGQPPWTGEQKFVVTVPNDKGQESIVVAARITDVPLVVVATRALVPGDIVQSTDVKLAQAKSDAKDILFHSLEDVVGQQARRSVVEGQPVKEDDLQSPLLVRRNDPVTVYARSAGIQVRTMGRAQDDGGKGDVIVIESMLTRERFLARVSGIHEVEVFAQTADAGAATSTVERTAQALKPARRNTTLGKNGAAGARVGGFRLPGQPVIRQSAAPLDEARPMSTERR